MRTSGQLTGQRCSASAAFACGILAVYGCGDAGEISDTGNSGGAPAGAAAPANIGSGGSLAGTMAARGGSGGSTAGTMAAHGGKGGSAAGTGAGRGGAGGAGGSGGNNAAHGGSGGSAAGAGGGGGTNAGSGGTHAGSGGAAGMDTPPLEPGLRWVGRVDDNTAAAVRFAWQGAGFVAHVRGSAIRVKLRTENTETVFFQPVIDNEPTKRFEVRAGADREITLGSGLDDSEHRVELYRDTEGSYGVSVFLGFTAGTVLAPPANPKRSIEVIGDSISAGYGNLGSEPHPNGVATPACGWTAENSTWYQTYGAIAGHALGAEVSTIACSGWGMSRDYSGNTANVLPAVYDNALGMSSNDEWSFDTQPNVVVINLGTNDWSAGDPGTSYESAYSTFLKHVREVYPDAWLFLTIGSTFPADKLAQVSARLQTVVNARMQNGDLKITTFDLGSQDVRDGMATGCGWHPNVVDHRRMAEILKKQLSMRLGW